jgi:hypothetical protein
MLTSAFRQHSQRRYLQLRNNHYQGLRILDSRYDSDAGTSVLDILIHNPINHPNELTCEDSIRRPNRTLNPSLRLPERPLREPPVHLHFAIPGPQYSGGIRAALRSRERTSRPADLLLSHRPV